MGRIPALLDSVLSYKTIKIVTIHNWKLGLLHYAIQLGIILYIILWVIVFKKGYQGQSGLVGEVNIKLKGVATYNDSMGNFQVWDEFDAVNPQKEEDAFFITTSVLSTLNQTRSTCPGVTSASLCSTTENCTKIKGVLETGWNTGICDTETNHCKIHAWCPAEDEDKQSSNTLRGIEQFTALVKVSVLFEQYGILRSNLNGTGKTDFYNFWKIQDMLNQAQVSLQDVEQQGGLFVVLVNWDCDFDKDQELCIPTFDFQRIDQKVTWSSGYNFRYTHNYWFPYASAPNGRLETRDLFKVYGLRFIFLVAGTGAKFDIVPLIVNLASGLALLSVATVVADLIALYILPQRKTYQDHKYEDVDQRFSMIAHKDSESNSAQSSMKETDALLNSHK